MKRFMARALELAARGRGYTSPNPTVGAVIVKGSDIVGEGYHTKAGAPHAEIEAINSTDSSKLTGATMFVTLEPCSHYGRTPPCTDAILRSGITKVVCAMEDPNPKVAGNGIRILKDNGLDVQVGILEAAAKKLNEAYIKFILTGEPFVTMKIAQTVDGKIALPTGDSKWITGEPARKDVHKLRAFNDAILVGRRTLDKDNPHLTVRYVEGRSPHRFILSAQGKFNAKRNVFIDNQAKTTIITSNAVVWEDEAATPPNCDIWKIGDHGAPIPGKALLNKMGAHSINSLLVEGGRATFSCFLKQSLVDKLIVFIAPRIMGNGINSIEGFSVSEINSAPILKNLTVTKIGEDIKMEGYFNE